MIAQWFLLAMSMGVVAVVIEWRLLQSVFPHPPARRPPLQVIAAIFCAYAGWYAIEVGRTRLQGPLELRTMLAWPTVGYAVPHVWLLWRLLTFRECRPLNAALQSWPWPRWFLPPTLFVAGVMVFVAGGTSGLAGTAGAAAVLAAIVVLVAYR